MHLKLLKNKEHKLFINNLDIAKLVNYIFN